MPLKKPDPVASDNGTAARDRIGDDWILYPTLMEYLAEDRWEDGTPRRTSTITVFADEGQIKGSLNDRALDRVAFATATSIEGLLVLLEEKLKASSIDWRPSGGNGKKRR